MRARSRFYGMAVLVREWRIEEANSLTALREAFELPLLVTTQVPVVLPEVSQSLTLNKHPRVPAESIV